MGIFSAIRRFFCGGHGAGSGQALLGPEDFDRFRDLFRNDHERLLPGADYRMHEPAYRFGWNLGASDWSLGFPWHMVEPEARRMWEECNPGTWETYAKSVNHGWCKCIHQLNMMSA